MCVKEGLKVQGVGMCSGVGAGVCDRGTTEFGGLECVKDYWVGGWGA